MGKIACLFGRCTWVLQPGSVVMGQKESFTWKCSVCGKKRVSGSDTDPTKDAA